MAKQKEQIDLSRSVIVRNLPQGDLIRIRTEEQVQEAYAKLPYLPARGEAGGMPAVRCEHCNAPFRSHAQRDAHIRTEHMDLGPQFQTFEMPDGTRVPVEELAAVYAASKTQPPKPAAAGPVKK